MAIKLYTYHDIPRHIRVQRAGERIRQLQETLSNPVATAEQREEAPKQREYMLQWAAGTLPLAPTPAPVDEPVEMVSLAPPLGVVELEETQPGQDHTVEVQETLETRDSTP
jgi:hypothetical protein